MADVTIRVTGIDKLQRKLNAVQVRKVLRDPMERSLKKIQRQMAEYPPKLTSSTYIRTDKLKQKWTDATVTIRKSGTGLRGKVGNNIPYAIYVQSYRHQAWMHRGRWMTDRQILERNRRAILNDFQQAIDRALRG